MFQLPFTILVFGPKSSILYFSIILYYIGGWSAILYLGIILNNVSQHSYFFCFSSPLLFALYIRGIAHLLTNVNTGLSVGHFTLAGLIIADNIVVGARTEEDLKGVLNIHRVEYEKIKMELSVDKSQEVSPRTSNLRPIGGVGQTHWWTNREKFKL